MGLVTGSQVNPSQVPVTAPPFSHLNDIINDNLEFDPIYTHSSALNSSTNNISDNSPHNQDLKQNTQEGLGQ